MEPERTPCCVSRAWTLSMSARPLGRSQRAWRAMVGVEPVSRCTSAASANFSSMVEAAASWINLPKRVPVLAKPHEGISIWKLSSAWKARCCNCESDAIDALPFLCHGNCIGHAETVSWLKAVLKFCKGINYLLQCVKDMDQFRLRSRTGR